MNTIKHLGARIRAERETQQISRSELAKAAGIAVSTLSDLELGESKSTSALHKIAARLGVSPHWLETGKGPKTAGHSVAADDWTDITGFAQSAAAGDGSAPDDYAETHTLKFKSSSLRRKGLFARKLAVFYARGDSMLPRIHDGDALLFDQGSTSPEDDKIFIVRFEGHFYAKRLLNLGGEWFLASDNPYDPRWRKPIPVRSDETFEIVGRVRWIGSWED